MRWTRVVVPAAAFAAACSMPAATVNDLLFEAEAMGAPAVARSAQTAVPADDRRLVRTGTIRLRVDDIRLATAAADSLAVALGGYVSQSRFIERGGSEPSSLLTLRIPTESFDVAWDGLSGLGSVTSGEVGTEDVTAAYRDLEIRLGVKEEAAERLRRLLSDRTGDLSDVLNVERELSRVVTELEQLKGEQAYLRERLALSTLTVHLFVSEAAIGPNLPPSIASALTQSLSGLRAAAAWALYLTVYLAPWAIVLALVWLLGRTVRRRLRSDEASRTTTPSP